MNARRFETRSSIDEDARPELVGILNAHLADTTDLFSQAKHAHWNVKGSDFQQLHLLFDEFADVLVGHADTIAERTASLGGEATGTVRMAADASRLDEVPADAIEGEDYVRALADAAAAHGESLLGSIDATMDLGDPITSDMLTEMAHDVDKYRWFLEAHLQGEASVVAQDVAVPPQD